MLQDTLRACGYFASVKATYQENGLLSGDSSFYILHTQPGNIAGNILSISNNGEFGYLPNAIFESVYYISLVNFNSVFSTFREDPCAVVTPGQPVIFHAQPSLIPDIKVSSCVPEADIEITTDGFSSGWKVVSSPSGSSFTFNNDKLISDTKGVYMIEFFSENNWCINVSLSEIILYDGPVLNQSETFCKDTAFIVELSWLGGIGPYTVLNQVVNETFLSSGRIPSGKVWSIDITDARGCSTGELNFTKECNCTSFLGSFEDDGFILCEGENLILQQPENTILSPGQLVYFDILRRENNQDIILATASIGTLFYNPDWLGDTLYIRPVAGLQNTDGSIDRNDPCLVSGNAVLLIWKSKPDWILPETWSVCPGQDFVIPILNIENQEFTLFYLRNNKKDSIVIKDALFEWTLSANGPDLPEILSVTGSENRFCKKDTIWNITLISALDWNASIKPEFIFTDTTNMLVYFETDLTLDEITNIEWTFLSSDTIVNSVNPELLISSSQTGAVAIEITDKMGCRLNLQTNILVRQTKEKFIFSNIIRNNSVENGRFLIYPQEAIALIETFAVFDRWGNKQFLSENQLPEEFNWQGTCKDGPCPDGVYVFYLKLVDKQGKTYFLSDDITIIGQ